MQFAQYGGGRLIRNAEVTAIFLGSTFGSPGLGDWATDPVLKGYACRLNTFLDDLLDSAYMDRFAQYDSPDGIYKIGRGQRVNSVFVPFVNQQANELTHQDLQGYLESAFSTGTLPASNDNSIYLFYLPPQYSADDIPLSYTSGTTGKDVVGGAVLYFPPMGALPTTLPDPFDYYTYYSSHQIAEIITAPDRPSGWVALQQGYRFPIASGLCFGEVQQFHGYYVAETWDQTGTCSCPPDDGQKKPPRSVRVAIATRACYPNAAEGANAMFFASLVNYPPGAAVTYTWSVVDATAIDAKSNRVTVRAPAAGVQFTVSVQVTDSYGCSVNGTLVATAVSEGQAEFVERFCQLRHLILKYWFLEPIWGPERELGSMRFEEPDMVRLERQADTFSRSVKGIRSSFEKLRSAPQQQHR